MAAFGEEVAAEAEHVCPPAQPCVGLVIAGHAVVGFSLGLCQVAAADGAGGVAGVGAAVGAGPRGPKASRIVVGGGRWRGGVGVWVGRPSCQQASMRRAVWSPSGSAYTPIESASSRTELCPVTSVVLVAYLAR